MEKIVVVLCLLFVFVTASFAANVTYDHRAMVIDGKRRVLVSGSIHYPRSTPEVFTHFSDLLFFLMFVCFECF